MHRNPERSKKPKTATVILFTLFSNTSFAINASWSSFSLVSDSQKVFIWWSALIEPSAFSCLALKFNWPKTKKKHAINTDSARCLNSCLVPTTGWITSNKFNQHFLLAEAFQCKLKTHWTPDRGRNQKMKRTFIFWWAEVHFYHAAQRMTAVMITTKISLLVEMSQKRSWLKTCLGILEEAENDKIRYLLWFQVKLKNKFCSDYRLEFT